MHSSLLTHLDLLPCASPHDVGQQQHSVRGVRILKGQVQRQAGSSIWGNRREERNAGTGFCCNTAACPPFFLRFRQGQRRGSQQKFSATPRCHELRAAAVALSSRQRLTGAVGGGRSVRKPVMPHGPSPAHCCCCCAVCLAMPAACAQSPTLQRPSQRQQRRQVGRRVPLQGTGAGAAAQDPQRARASSSSTHTHTQHTSADAEGAVSVMGVGPPMQLGLV